MTEFSHNASAFNCRWIAFKKLDMGWVPSPWFAWQQQHHSRRQQFDKQNAFNWRRSDLMGGFNFNVVVVNVFTTRAYARAVLGVVILSVRLFTCLSHVRIVTKLNDALQIFWYHTKGQSLCYSDTNSGFAPFPLKSALKVTHPPSKNANFVRFPLITSQP